MNILKAFLVRYLRYIVFIIALVVSVITNNYAFVLVVVIESIVAKVIGKINIKKLFLMDRKEERKYEIFKNIIATIAIISLPISLFLSRDIGALLMVLTQLTMSAILLAMCEAIIKWGIKAVLKPNESVGKLEQFALGIIVTFFLIFAVALFMQGNDLTWEIAIKALKN
ncbi:MAG TPA: hypothetical protein DEP72_04925 [Clostridiales bacterium]|nr:MAG: hypothetical protein A2Y18_02030 [Clostridiales bacterium GWD2_32_19]HCC07483.1 hypothetical protein [Clostridiales bacterium]